MNGEDVMQVVRPQHRHRGPTGGRAPDHSPWVSCIQSTLWEQCLSWPFITHKNTEYRTTSPNSASLFISVLFVQIRNNKRVDDLKLLLEAVYSFMTTLWTKPVQTTFCQSYRTLYAFPIQGQDSWRVSANRWQVGYHVRIHTSNRQSVSQQPFRVQGNRINIEYLFKYK